MKKFLALILALCMTLALVACGDGNNNSTPSNSDTQPANNDSQPSGDSTGKTVGIAMPTKSLERWNRDGDYLDKQFQAVGYKTILTFSDDKAEQQVNDIQNMLAQGVDLLVIAAIDDNALNTVMNDAGAANIPVRATAHRHLQLVRIRPAGAAQGGGPAIQRPGW